MPVSGSTSVAAQRTMRLTTFSRALGPTAITVSSRSNSCQAGQPSTWRLPRKRSGWTGAPAASSSAATEARLMIETTFCATSEKLWPAACSTFGGPRSSSAQNSAKNRLDRGAAFRRAKVAAGGLAVLRADGQRMARLVEGGAQLGQAGRSASASGSAAWGDSRAPPDRSRTARSRWHTSGRRARSAGRPAPSAAAARATAPSPDSGKWPGFSRAGRLMRHLINGPAAALKALTKIKAIPLPARHPVSYILGRRTLM